MSQRHSICSSAGVLFCILTCFAAQVALAAAEPKRVMLLHSFGREFRPWSEYGKAIRIELDRQSPWPLDITDHPLVTARFNQPNTERLLVDYLRAVYTNNPLDLLVSIGSPAAEFVQRYRDQLFPATPLLLTAVEQRRVRHSSLTANDTVAAVSNDFVAFFENILRVLPETKTIAIVNGVSPLERFWAEEIRKETKPFENRIEFIWYSDLSFEDILKRAAALPAHSAIFWQVMAIDAAGVVHEGDAALGRLYAVANAPIFAYNEAYFGREIVGGPLHTVADLSRQAAAVGVRILGGEKPGDIKTPATGFGTPKFDWRAMQRWGISESRLPPGSEVYFRTPSVWQQYRLEMSLISAALIVQAALIGWLIYEHRRRHVAEVQSRNSMAELTYLNRKAAVGEVSASIAHEVNQPLAGITARASAALRWLAGENPDLNKARASLTQIVEAGHRAGEIVASVRAMFKNDTSERALVDINIVVSTVLAIVRVDLRKNGVELRTQFQDQLPPVKGDRVQLQQVVLNLVMNGIEAMHAVQPRVLTVRSDQSKPNTVHVSVQDTGEGVDQSHLDQIFKPLFTTKGHGMGMGLSICRSIIESHEGRIWVTCGANGGCVFHFELPTPPQ